MSTELPHRYDLEALGLDPERATLAHEIWALNQQVHDRAMAMFGPSDVPLDLTVQQLRALNFVVGEPGLTSQDLAHRLEVSAPTASGLVDRLVEKAVVERRLDEADRRLRRLYPTETGLQATRQGDSLFERALVAVVQLMSIEDMQAMKRSSQTMLEVFSRFAPPSPSGPDPSRHPSGGPLPGDG